MALGAPAGLAEQAPIDPSGRWPMRWLLALNQ